MKAGIAVCVLGVLVASCASAPERPVLYPNAMLERTGQEAANAAISQCLQLADNADLNNPGGQVAKGAATGAAVGGATGLAVGAVLGHPLRGLVVGAAGGAAGGATRGAIRGSQPSPLYKNYVNHCLYDKGYEVIGWR